MVLLHMPVNSRSNLHRELYRNLNETLQIHRFRVKQKITPENEVVLIQSLFQDDHVQQTLSVRPSLFYLCCAQLLILPIAPSHKATDRSDMQAASLKRYEHGFL